MGRHHALLAVALPLLLLGCAGPTASPGGLLPEPTGGRVASPSAPVSPPPSGWVPFQLLTHCGIDEVVFHDRYYEAVEPLSDGNGNPPAGWDNPYQAGRIAVLPGGELEFRDDRGHVVRFRERVGATGVKAGCD